MVARTPVYGLPYIEPTDRAREIADQQKAAMLLLESILLNEGQVPIGGDVATILRRTADTGWITIVRAGIATGDGFRAETNIQARKIGSVVYLSGRVNNASAPSASALLTLPADMRPGSTIYAPGVLGWAQTTVFYAGGTVQMTANVARPTGSSGYPLDGISFVTG